MHEQITDTLDQAWTWARGEVLDLGIETPTICIEPVAMPDRMRFRVVVSGGGTAGG